MEEQYASLDRLDYDIHMDKLKEQATEWSSSEYEKRHSELTGKLRAANYNDFTSRWETSHGEMLTKLEDDKRVYEAGLLDVYFAPYGGVDKVEQDLGIETDRPAVVRETEPKKVEKEGPSAKEEFNKKSKEEERLAPEDVTAEFNEQHGEAALSKAEKGKEGTAKTVVSETANEYRSLSDAPQKMQDEYAIHAFNVARADLPENHESYQPFVGEEDHREFEGDQLPLFASDDRQIDRGNGGDIER